MFFFFQNFLSETRIMFLDVFVLLAAIGLVVYFILGIKELLKRIKEVPETDTQNLELQKPQSKTNSLNSKVFFTFSFRKKVTFDEKRNQVYIIM